MSICLRVNIPWNNRKDSNVSTLPLLWWKYYIYVIYSYLNVDPYMKMTFINSMFLHIHEYIISKQNGVLQA